MGCCLCEHGNGRGCKLHRTTTENIRLKLPRHWRIWIATLHPKSRICGCHFSKGDQSWIEPATGIPLAKSVQSRLKASSSHRAQTSGGYRRLLPKPMIVQMMPPMPGGKRIVLVPAPPGTMPPAPQTAKIPTDDANPPSDATAVTTPLPKPVAQMTAKIPTDDANAPKDATAVPTPLPKPVTQKTAKIPTDANAPKDATAVPPPLPKPIAQTQMMPQLPVGQRIVLVQAPPGMKLPPPGTAVLLTNASLQLVANAVPAKIPIAKLPSKSSARPLPAAVPRRRKPRPRAPIRVPIGQVVPAPDQQPPVASGNEMSGPSAEQSQEDMVLKLEEDAFEEEVSQSAAEAAMTLEMTTEEEEQVITMTDEGHRRPRGRKTRRAEDATRPERPEKRVRSSTAPTTAAASVKRTSSTAAASVKRTSPTAAASVKRTSRAAGSALRGASLRAGSTLRSASLRKRSSEIFTARRLRTTSSRQLRAKRTGRDAK